MSSIKSKFGKHLKELRKCKGYTQEHLAELVSIEPPNLSKIECGMHFPQPEKIEKLANALDVEVSELFDFEHLKEKNILTKSILKSLNSFDTKQIEFVYKMVNALKVYK